jgi:hypothetical protein
VEIKDFRPISLVGGVYPGEEVEIRIGKDYWKRLFQVHIMRFSEVENFWIRLGS